MKILVINAGSSSLKYQLLDMANESVLAKGLCERIGIDGHLKHISVTGNKSIFDEDIMLQTHSEAISVAIETLMSDEYGVMSDAAEISAIGHRVVHGGESFSAAVLIDENVMKAIKDCVPLAPLHNPANIMGIEACSALMGDIPQVAVFDTSFHQTMPPRAYMYAIPYEYYERDKVRRYGFHGTSHRYVAERAAALLGKPLEELKLISCHMGNGTSLCAIKNGKSIDTSMGFTPIAGIPMGTRCGELDVSILQFLMKRGSVNIDDMINILNRESGVLGISGVSSDFRDLASFVEEGNERAALALDMFHYSVAKRVGEYVVAMSGADAIIFTAGIGENGINHRSSIAKHLTCLGFYIDEEKNRVSGEETDISKDDSPGRILVIPTNEELAIARDTLKLVGRCVTVGKK